MAGLYSPDARYSNEPMLLARFRHLATFLMLCLSPCWPIHAAAAEARTHVRQEGNLLLVDGWLEVNVERALAWSVLTDYERFPQFVPGIRMNRLLGERDGGKFVEQQGEMNANGLRMPYGGQMRIEEVPGQGLRILFLNGLFKDVQGEWKIGGAKPLRLEYRMRMDLLKAPFPPMLATRMAEQQVRVWVGAFAGEMERLRKPEGQSKP